MGEASRFTVGQQAPNDGEYMEIGNHAVHMSINNPKHVHLKKGERFPENTNDDRVWVKKEHAITH
ncbi:MAG: YjzC-like protein [Paenibacillaceae bacterium]|nr:YjzC-like protein [Paenibacillaceae bacterium]